ncbi:beta-eliminating lyase-related protein [Gordonia sp. CPCC 205515]|uniref:threonine aldolase family protein n=1 Tax=Gordonia sp. CPCC 205515 TaxID=3140791 RepID=UPI003AF33AF1
MTVTTLDFSSDNHAGVHADVLTAISAANDGYQPAYGGDSTTERLRAAAIRQFGEGTEIFPVFNGTAANVVALQSMLPRWGAVITSAVAHINTDEGGAPEKVAGIKMLGVPTPDGKLTPDLIDREAWGWGDEHRSQPAVVSLTQTTEFGTVYTPEELAAVCEHVHALGMTVHMDGSRISNAAASLGLPLQTCTREVGIDVLSFGGTKNGAMCAEAVVVLNPGAAQGLPYLRKFDMQLASKMRFISAQLLALLDDDLYLRNARHANDMAQRLRTGIEAGLTFGAIRDVAFAQPTDANAVFAELPDGVADRLRKYAAFHSWPGSPNLVRWMCSFATTPDEVDAFLEAIADVTGSR